MYELRASDAEREETVDAAARARAVGRLTVDELDERCEQAYAARTVAELADLVADLPPPDSALAPAVPGTAAAGRPEPLPAVRGIGARPFTYEWELEVAPDDRDDRGAPPHRARPEPRAATS